MPAPTPAPGRVRVGKVPFEVADIESAVKRVIEAGLNREAISIRLSNAYCVALASTDSAYERILNGPGINYPDGTPVVWFMRLRQGSAGRVRGPSLFRAALKASAEAELSNFFLGTTDTTLARMNETLTRETPGLKIAGSYSPPFGPVDQEFLDKCQRKVQESRADLLWVALGTPKQDYAAFELSARLGIPCIAVGAAFDFAAGSSREAPLWMQNSGTEWLFRFATEPKRLWRRYILGNLRFIYSAIGESGRK